jgi:hypothetical protein
MDEATRCSRLLLLRQAELLADGTLDELQQLTGQSDPEQVFLHLIDDGVPAAAAESATGAEDPGTGPEGRMSSTRA